MCFVRVPTKETEGKVNQYLLVYRYISEIAHYESCLPRNEAMNRDENRMDGRMDGYIYGTGPRAPPPTPPPMVMVPSPCSPPAPPVGGGGGGFILLSNLAMTMVGGRGRGGRWPLRLIL